LSGIEQGVTETRDAAGWQAYNNAIAEEFRANKGRMIIVGSLGGAPNHPDWVHNLRANPRAFVEVGESSYDIVARELPPAEHDETFPKVVALQPLFGEYQNRTTRVIPLFELQRV
jgi:deazaflavin-dependent oxidoreductase (nitroreductase family)